MPVRRTTLKSLLAVRLMDADSIDNFLSVNIEYVSVVRRTRTLAPNSSGHAPVTRSACITDGTIPWALLIYTQRQTRKSSSGALLVCSGLERYRVCAISVRSRC